MLSRLYSYIVHRSMAPTLYYFLGSPAARAVLLTGKAIGLEFNLKEVVLPKGQQFDPEFLKINPQHTVPTLVEEDGFVLWDSHAIMAYLVDKYSKDDSLYPRDVRKRAVVNQRLHFEDGTLFGRLRPLAKMVIFMRQTSVPQEYIDDIEEAYMFLEKFLEKSEYVAGNQLTIADFSVVATITSLVAFLPISPEYKRILAWLKKMEGLPYYQEANQKGADMFVKAVKARLRSRL